MIHKSIKFRQGFFHHCLVNSIDFLLSNSANFLSPCILCIHIFSKSHSTPVGFKVHIKVFNYSGSLSYTNGKDTCRHRVQRSCMPYLPGSQNSPHFSHYIVGSHIFLFIDNNYSVNLHIQLKSPMPFFL